MPLLLGLDLGTTTVTAVALECERHELRAVHTLPTPPETTRPAEKERGRREHDASALLDAGLACLRELVERLGPAVGEVVGLGLTGQQHGVVVVDRSGRPLTPFIGWQDQRGNEAVEDEEGGAFVERARRLAGPDASDRTGCRLATGYMGTTLFWLRRHGLLPKEGTACFLTDLASARWSGATVATDPTGAASSGLLDIERCDWDQAILHALGL